MRHTYPSVPRGNLPRQDSRPMTVPLPRETQSGFQEGSDGHCLIEALTARQVQYRYLEEGEITNPRHSRPIIGFWIGGVRYYFDGWLRRGDTTGIPAPYIHGEAVDNFVNDKGLIKAFLHRNGFSVPEGKVFDYQSAEEAEQVAEAGLSPDDIPPAGERVFLRRRPNEDEATDATELLHPSYGELIERAIGLLPVLPICGVDLIVRDTSAPASPDNYFILELNAPARFVDHRYPWSGGPRDVAGAIVDYLLLAAQSERAARDIQGLCG
jgi:hypothetical protein